MAMATASTTVGQGARLATWPSLRPSAPFSSPSRRSSQPSPSWSLTSLIPSSSSAAMLATRSTPRFLRAPSIHSSSPSSPSRTISSNLISSGPPTVLWACACVIVSLRSTPNLTARRSPPRPATTCTSTRVSSRCCCASPRTGVARSGRSHRAPRRSSTSSSATPTSSNSCSPSLKSLTSVLWPRLPTSTRSPSPFSRRSARTACRPYLASRARVWTCANRR
mmetsp:Transcript_18737/g.38057  ORF Transcript_18737/g.38057 Transcript_18737/m.38057 type:complete len:222 (-) Transcript_18737:2946-3611(-)